MPSFSKNEVVLVRYPFTDQSISKVRPAVVVSTPHESADAMVVPLTSRVSGLRRGEFALADWAAIGLHVPTAAKRGLYTVSSRLVLKSIGRLTPADAAKLEQSLRAWLGLS